MSRKLSAVIALFALAASPAGAIDVRVSPAAPACAAGQSGLSGTAESGGAKIRFWSCARGEDYCHSRIWSDSGQAMTEILSDGPSIFRVWMAGIEATDGVTEEQSTRMQTAMSGPERAVAAQLLAGLRSVGIDETSDPARCLSYHAQAYEGGTAAPAGGDCGGQCSDVGQGCRGCCGAGCTGGDGCNTACTWECYLHDDLCGFSLNPACVTLFVLAAKSMKNCYATHAGCGRGGAAACACC